MKKLYSIKTIITSILLATVLFANCINITYAQEERATVTFSLSQELVNEGYRIVCYNNADTKQCNYNGDNVVSVEVYLRDDQRVTTFPAVNNGKNWYPVDIEFRVNGTLVSKPNESQGYRPWVLDSFAKWNNGTTFVAQKRRATINYYDNNELLNSQTIIAGNDASEFIPVKADIETEAYTFEKWVDADMNEIPLTGIQYDTNVYAVYSTTPKYFVSFMNENNTLTSTRVLEGNSAISDVTPTKDSLVYEDDEYTYTTDYTFAYWEVNGNEVDLSSYTIHEETIFNAVFSEETTSTKKEVAPVTPTTPETPNKPTTPSTPVTPVVPTTPETPNKPTTPSIPVTPVVPTTPETSVIPSNPAAPVTPKVPVVTETNNNVTNVTETTTIPEVVYTQVAVNNTFVPEEQTLETISDETTPTNNPVINQETILEDESPLAKPVSITTTWSLMNLILMLATVLLGIYNFMKKRETSVSTVFSKAFATVLLVGSIATFFLTQDVMSVMNITDGWTIAMTIILAVQVAVVYFHKQAISK